MLDDAISETLTCTVSSITCELFANTIFICFTIFLTVSLCVSKCKFKVTSNLLLFNLFQLITYSEVITEFGIVTIVLLIPFIRVLLKDISTTVPENEPTSIQSPNSNGLSVKIDAPAKQVFYQFLSCQSNDSTGKSKSCK